ncbi:cytochrome C oxidase assembly protein [Aliiroseovarius crassostreae]|uniref:cytochrome C oxidase assembly protein n=1 Tax=Aliiroseovarius crassostreae TaxID=154981 RepID=UPI0022063415|nr:cytochrome C oxidase assembly protein [Aliiroseovarius crassostreae]UWQ05422.1 cytochrome C oxidase assembly protein [Aliiroseovarius crassostreae]
MTFKPDHDLHKRRFGRNMGLGAVLIGFVVLVYGITVVKTSELYKPAPANAAASSSAVGAPE